MVDVTTELTPVQELYQDILDIYHSKGYQVLELPKLIKPSQLEDEIDYIETGDGIGTLDGRPTVTERLQEGRTYLAVPPKISDNDPQLDLEKCIVRGYPFDIYLYTFGIVEDRIAVLMAEIFIPVQLSYSEFFNALEGLPDVNEPDSAPKSKTK